MHNTKIFHYSPAMNEDFEQKEKQEEMDVHTMVKMGKNEY
jgi:hypothetical protein